MICLRLLLNVSKGKSFVDHTDKGAKLCLGFLFINFSVISVSNDRYDKQQGVMKVTKIERMKFYILCNNKIPYSCMMKECK